MGWINLIVGSHALHNSVKAYLNILNDIAIFVEPTPQTNITKSYTILTLYSINQGLKVFEKRQGYSTKIIAAVSWPKSCRAKESSIPHL